MVFRGRLVDIFLELMSAQTCVSYFFRITLDTVIADEPSTSERKPAYYCCVLQWRFTLLPKIENLTVYLVVERLLS